MAENAGFCYGVDRAVKKVYKELDNHPLYTYGPIIHNRQVVEALEKKGVTIIHSIEELDQHEPGTIIIRSHGIPKQDYEEIEKRGYTIVDATCPYVKRIHQIVAKCKGNGNILIIGNKDHPEVRGILGWCDNQAMVVQTTEEIDRLHLPKDEPLGIVVQTTFNRMNYKKLIEKIQKKGYDVDIYDTICSATEEIQTEAYKLAQQVDKMIVIGGKHSSNTQKLFNICQSQCENTYHIETLDDLELNVFNEDDIIGITAGASTPKNIIEEVYINVRNTARI